MSGKNVIATFRAWDKPHGKLIKVLYDETTHAIVLDNGEHADLPTPVNMEHAMRIVWAAWGRWDTFEMDFQEAG